MKFVQVFLVGAVALTFQMAQAAPVYLRTLGAEETRATQDGASWATAFTTVAAAVQAARTGDGVIHAAAGVYVVPEKIDLAASLAIVGGFSGVAGEAAEDRDLAQNETIFTGDANGDDVYAHVTFDTERNAVTETTLADAPVISPLGGIGRFCPPPAYASAYDIYLPAAAQMADNTSACFEITEPTASLSIDGVMFTGFSSNRLNGNIIKCPSGHRAALALTNCQFLAFASYEGSVWTETSTQLTLCRTRFAYARAARNAGVNVKGPAAVADGSFESIYGTEPLRANALFVHAGAGAVTVERTAFVRLGKASYVNVNYGGPAAAVGGEQAAGRKLFRGCVVSNCFAVVTSGSAEGSLPIVSPNCGAWEFDGCRFVGNWAASRTVNGRSYTLFGVQSGRTTGKALWRNCVFDANVCVSTATTAGSGGSYALGICGSAATAADQVYLNCVFDRNRVEARAAASDVTVVRSQGVLAAATVGAVRTSVANGTFRARSEAGVVDIAQYGDQHAAPVNVVNSLFMSDADVATPFHAPNGASSENGLCVYSSTAQNVLQAPSSVVDGGGWQFDAVPFETAADGVLMPTVCTPGLRSSADLAEVAATAVGALPTFRFRPAGETDWLPLNGDTRADADAVAVADIVGDARPDGASTRGAKQVLMDAAEQGKALVLRRSPLMGGTLDGPSAQSVTAGATAAPVTANATDGATFQGWYREDGTLHSSDATLAVGALDADLVLTAKFLTREVNLTFDLGDGGTFVANGRATIVVTARAGEPFPGVPAYTASPAWVVTGFDAAFPDYVPDADATWRAELLTTAVRVFRVVPKGDLPADSDRSGTSWANATDDIAAAMADAARHRGELWLKAGAYVVTNAFDIRANVGLYGGFVGTETARDEADPSLRVTRLTGVRANGSCTAVAFSGDAISMTTNSVFAGLVFDSFGTSAIRFGSTALRSTCRIEACAFENCGFGSSQAATVLSYGTVQVRDCRFVGCRTGVIVGWGTDTAVGDASVVADSLFEACEAETVPVVWLSNKASGATVTNCTFRRNRAKQATALLSLVTSERSVRFADCRFEANTNDVTAAGAASLAALINVSQNSVFERCRFVGNTNTTSATSGVLAGLFSLRAYQACPVIRDCFFEANAMRATEAASEAVCASVAAAHQGNFLFANCTFKDNAAEAGASGVAATAVAGAYPYTSLAFVHGTLANSVLTGGTCAELYQLPGAVDNPRTSALSVFNSILVNSDAAYRPLAPRAGSPLLVSGGHLSNARAADFDLTDAASVFRRVSTADPRLTAEVSTSKAEVWAWGVGHDTPLRRTGEKVWFANGAAWFCDAETNAARPWRSVLDPTARRASVDGLTAESPLLPDAFGAPRARPGAGPLVVPRGGLAVIIR